MYKNIFIKPFNCFCSSNILLKEKKSSNIKKLCTSVDNISKWKEPVGYNTGIEIYNCVAKKKVPLILRNKNLATWYTCGPTVYAPAHIGHAVCYLNVDILQRVLRNYFDINLITVLGITDVDDKIINRAREQGELHSVLAKRYENEFLSEIKAFNISPSHMIARVTDYIPHIISFTQKLLSYGQAYKSEGGSIYFATKDYDKYGKLENIKLDNKKQEGKEFASDFALWKGAKENEPYWEAPWGKGRPGWHIECSTMASYLLGRVVDIHAGGIDLRFPHHENEEAQSCAYHDCDQWVNYWIHTGHLQMKDSGKMSKSLKNTISISEFLKKYSPDVLRTACLLSHYRSHMVYSESFMDHASAIYKKIHTFLTDCTAYTNGIKPKVDIDEAYLFYQVDIMNKSIEESLKDDFDTAKCMSSILSLIDIVNKIINSNKSSNQNYIIAQNCCIIAMIQSSIEKHLKLFGMQMYEEKTTANIDYTSILNSVVQVRDDIRQIALKENRKSMFEFCDKIRNDLKALGIEIKDHGKASSWSFVNQKNN